MKDKAIIIVDATDSMTRALANQLAQQGARLHLGGRDREEVERIARDLEIRYQVKVSWDIFEPADYGTHPEFLEKAIHVLGHLDGVAVYLGELGDRVNLNGSMAKHSESQSVDRGQGLLARILPSKSSSPKNETIPGDQSLAQTDFNHAQLIIDSNYTSVVSILTHVANYLEKQSHGWIVCISSVAGDRGRQSNYIYGSAKGGVSLFLQGLRNRLAKSGVHVLTAKHGFVDNKIAFGKPGMFLVASPERVASDILRALQKGKNIAYVPWFWWGIMLIIRNIPESLFKWLNL